MTFLFADTPAFQGYLPAVYEDPKLRDLVVSGRPFRPPTRRRRKKPVKEPGVLVGGEELIATTPAAFTSGAEHWSDERLQARLDAVMRQIDWENTSGSARKWWEAFLMENRHRKALVLRLAEELAVRKSTVTEFFLAYIYSNTDNIQANLHYLDYTKLKRQEEAKRRGGETSGDSTE